MHIPLVFKTTENGNSFGFYFPVGRYYQFRATENSGDLKYYGSFYIRLGEI